MLWSWINYFMIEVFIHSFFLILTVIRQPIHFTIHQEVRFLIIDAWLVPVSKAFTNMFWVVHYLIISILKSGWLFFPSFLARSALPWSNILFFIVIYFCIFVFVGILSEVVIFIVINLSFCLCLWILVLRVSLWVSLLITSSWWTGSLSYSTSCSHSVWLLQLSGLRLIIWISILPMATRYVLMLS